MSIYDEVFIKVQITCEMRFEAMKRKCKSLEIYIKQKKSGYNSNLDKNDSWYTGGLGEAMFENKYPSAEYADKSGYDHIIQNLKTEMKLTRRTSMPPNENAFLLIPESEARRSVGKFIFGWVVGDLYEEKEGWLLGWLPCETFLKIARLKQKGDEQEETKFKYRENSYEIRVGEVHPMSSLFED